MMAQNYGKQQAKIINQENRCLSASCNPDCRWYWKSIELCASSLYGGASSWGIDENLSLSNVLGFNALCFLVIALFVVGILVTMIQNCPWGSDNLLALKRILIVLFHSDLACI
jgi:hypothetical protein